MCRASAPVLRNWAGSDIVAIGCSKRGGAPRLSHVSDVASLDRKTHRSRLYQKVMNEIEHRETPVLWPQDSEQGREGSLLLKELVRDTGMQQGAAVRLSGSGSETVILVMLWHRQEDRSQPLNELHEYGSLVAPLLLQTLRSERRSGPRDGTGGLSGIRKVIAAVILVVVLGWFLLLSYTVQPAPGGADQAGAASLCGGKI